ncbi:DUF1501 domain-containing protein [Ideonella sp. DXS29W]|uniref:DUF1501 domain-containing protein n=1 Tax=Ideonella lacteola TaxID=2984193 RepID=A0ABU9BKL5_9BURK
MTRNSSLPLRRRDWLRLAGGSIGLAAVGGAGALLGPRMAVAGDYKALVCIYLVGGNDGFNMLVPTDSRYAQYASARDFLALPKTSLLRLTGTDYGFHPSMKSLMPMWSDGVLAPIVNVGPLAVPLTKDDYVSAGPDSPLIPESLFSHSDQQRAWQCASNSGMERTGWGARTTETMALNYPVISLGGNSRFGTGEKAPALVLPGPGAAFATAGLAPGDIKYPADQKRKAAVDALYAPGQKGDIAEIYASIQRDAFEMSDRLFDLVKGVPGDDSVPAAIDNAFAPLIDGQEVTTELGAQLYQIAKLIAGRQQVQGDRHVYFASLGGFDTHANQIADEDSRTGTHADLLTEVATAMACFHNAMVKLGLSKQVTAFTSSDFGRTFLPNRSRGSDHAWGNVQLVCGGSVKGNATYGAYPKPVLGGPDDVGVEEWEKQGRWIPTSSVDQYASTLLKWFGATGPQIDAILPNLTSFPDRTLGFMQAG